MNKIAHVCIASNSNIDDRILTRAGSISIAIHRKMNHAGRKRPEYILKFDKQTDQPSYRDARTDDGNERAKKPGNAMLFIVGIQTIYRENWSYEVITRANKRTKPKEKKNRFEQN